MYSINRLKQIKTVGPKIRYTSFKKLVTGISINKGDYKETVTLIISYYVSLSWFHIY